MPWQCLGHMVQVRAERAHTCGHINIMTQALWPEDGFLPQGLTVQNTYLAETR